MLEQLGYGVDVVGNGAETVDAATGFSHAAVLMDGQVPEMDGYEATSVIQACVTPCPSAAAVACRSSIALTANAMAVDWDQCCTSPARMAE